MAASAKMQSGLGAAVTFRRAGIAVQWRAGTRRIYIYIKNYPKSQERITMQALTPVFYGSVNRWECDENDHLNVRFYAQKMHQTLVAGLLDLGLVTPTELPATLRQLTAQHMRYLAEARIAAPLTGMFGLLQTTATDFTVLTELHNTQTGQVQAAFTHHFRTPLFQADLATVSLPGHAGSRGLSAEPSAYASLALAEARAHGFSTIGRGVIQPDECSATGELLAHMYMGRVSDSMPNLWAKFAEPETAMTRGDGEEGGAVLEYRMHYDGQLSVGERFEVVSGVRQLGEKTQHFAHQVYSVDSGHCVVAAEAIAIAMDLKARRAMATSPARRAAMARFMLKSID
jgi:acyl-CoA thioester hydrolase